MPSNSELDDILDAYERALMTQGVLPSNITPKQRAAHALTAWRDGGVEEAKLKHEIRIHDDYWHMQNAVAKEGIGAIALRFKSAAQTALTKLRAAHSSREET
jgi:hypothetical protein